MALCLLVYRSSTHFLTSDWLQSSRGLWWTRGHPPASSPRTEPHRGTERSWIRATVEGSKLSRVEDSVVSSHCVQSRTEWEYNVITLNLIFILNKYFILSTKLATTILLMLYSTIFNYIQLETWCQHSLKKAGSSPLLLSPCWNG